jgi:hypothetical protein
MHLNTNVELAETAFCSTHLQKNCDKKEKEWARGKQAPLLVLIWNRKNRSLTLGLIHFFNILSDE